MSTPFITSAPSPHVPPASQNKPLIIDDTDAMVKYSGYWFVAGVLEGNQATSHGTQNKGATALLTFTGTAISVYGTITEAHQDVSSRVSTYSIDGAGLTTFTSPQPKSILYKQLFFQSPQLPHGQHTLVVTAGTGDAPFWLDYFEVYNPSASTRTYRHGSTFISPPSSEPSDPSTNHPVQLASKTSSHAGAIAGGVIGGLAALGVLITFLIIRRRRKSPAAYIPTAPNPGTRRRL
ncbi:hypothetical protein D9615_007671 [Tricholomella constricta]|uniref:Uncharacterized protein n=1 Tax=Tricholomella constricta TaxID=117010 RepID=A0A8H5H3Z2_9AGAR|nr:hypothetical protein D9615_007671 [Tricholomella constricta]